MCGTRRANYIYDDNQQKRRRRESLKYIYEIRKRDLFQDFLLSICFLSFTHLFFPLLLFRYSFFSINVYVLTLLSFLFVHCIYDLINYYYFSFFFFTNKQAYNIN